MRSSTQRRAAATSAGSTPNNSYVDLYWLPLGAGGHSVHFNGLVYEAAVARLARRARCDLYHSALEVRDAGTRYVIEMAPLWNERAADRGVVGEGAVGSRWLGGLCAFRYEIRRWPDGRIPDRADAVESPQRLTEDPAVARRVLELVPAIPRLVWGRDEAHAGDMWNSNSMTAWLLVRGGIDLRQAHVPAGGRAPGWDAGVALAQVRRPAANGGGPEDGTEDEARGASRARRWPGPGRRGAYAGRVRTAQGSESARSRATVVFRGAPAHVRG
jgi:hypothetical protein